MSDLISRKDVLALFPTNDCSDKMVGLYERVLDIPTAYDIDKIVEELELHSFEFGADTLPAHYVRLNEAIEIVKQGGVSDDVCEWRLCDEEANVYDTSCRNPHILIEGTPKENNYEYCPYCGKKIKIVGD